MKIHYLNGELTGKSREISPPEAKIGRETDNDLQMLVGGVSRYHAKLEFINGIWEIRDLGSTNGTKVNGTVITMQTPLKEGDIIDIGDQKFRLGESAEDESRQTAVRIMPPDAGVPEKIPSVIFRPIAPDVPPSPAQPSSPNPVLISVSGGKDEQAKVFAESFKSAESPSTGASEKTLTLSQGNIFGRQDANAKDQESSKHGFFGKSSRMSNLVFYTLVICIAIVCVAVFIWMQQGGASGGSVNISNEDAVKNKNPFLLLYEKQTVEKDNIFRFSLVLENNTATITLDDLKHSRHFQKNLGNIDPAILLSLENDVKATDFMKLEQESVLTENDGTDDYRTILAAYGNKLNKITVRKTPRSSFEKVENAIEEFAEAYGIRTVSLRVDEMKAEAEKAFLKAEALFDNYEARPENLREAILRYQLTMDFLDQFDPKPPEWDVSRKKLAEAQSLMSQRIKDAQFNVNVLVKKKQYSDAVAECAKIMDMVEPGSESYKKIRNTKINLEKIVAEQKK